MVSFTYVDTKESLFEAAREWGASTDLAVDLECENNLHHFGAYVTLVQISNQHKNWVVDILALTDLQPLVNVLENRSIQKIFHDVSFDFRILFNQFSCKPKNVFDTQIAALLLGKEHLGLGDLLRSYFSVEKESKFQMADWTKRPLNTELLAYAVKDTQYLIQLREMLKKELQQAGRLDWAEEEFMALEQYDFSYHEQDFMDVRGVKDFSPEQLGVFKRLFLLRQRLAKKVDRPSHFVINNARLKEFAMHPPQWERLNGVHPIVRREHLSFYEAVKEGKSDPVSIPAKERKRSTVKQKEVFEQLGEMQKKISLKLGIRGHLIINKDQMGEIAFNKNAHCLRNWQRKLLEQEGLHLE